MAAVAVAVAVAGARQATLASSATTVASATTAVPEARVPSGLWHSDDCSPTSHFLLDSSGEGANAQHALNASCVPGISGLGVNIRSPKDLIQVPDEPQFTVNERIAVAAWVHPNQVSGDQPIVLKRLNNQTSFSLGIHNGNIEMTVVLTSGKTVISQAPCLAGTWSHVAGMYDGTFVFLFLDGQQFDKCTQANPYETSSRRFALGRPRKRSSSTASSTKSSSRPVPFLQGHAHGLRVPAASLHSGSEPHHERPGALRHDGSLRDYGHQPRHRLLPAELLLRQLPVWVRPVDQCCSRLRWAPSEWWSPGASATFGAEVTANDSADPGVQ